MLGPFDFRNKAVEEVVYMAIIWPKGAKALRKGKGACKICMFDAPHFFGVCPGDQDDDNIMRVFALALPLPFHMLIIIDRSNRPHLYVNKASRPVIHRPMGRQAGRQTDRQTGRQTEIMCWDQMRCTVMR